jgi:hypothetical protein
MASSQQKEYLPTSLEHILPYPTSIQISPSSYLTVPDNRPSGRLSASQISDTSVLVEERSDLEPELHIIEPLPETTPPACYILPGRPYRPIPLSERVYMSVYSTSSVDTDLSEFSNPPARNYRTSTSQEMSRKITVVRLSCSIKKPQANHLRSRRSNISKPSAPTKSTPSSSSAASKKHSPSSVPRTSANP